MKAQVRLACLASLSLLVVFAVSCGSASAPTAPVEFVDYTVSGSAESADTAAQVDDEVRFYVNNQFVGSVTWSGVARFRASRGDTLVVRALDTCQGQYWLGPLWLHRTGVAAQQITPGVGNCAVASVPCLSPPDCGAPDRVFLEVSHTLS